jgi:plastocyanin
MTRSIRVPGGAVTLAVIALAVAVGALGVALVSRPDSSGPTMMRGGEDGRYHGGMGPRMMGGGFGYMMGGYDDGPQPGAPGFVAGTQASPRVVRILAGPGYAFSPSNLTILRGETVTFLVTTMGPYAHEFMVGPADAVAADREGTPEIADIGMMQTKALTYTFEGSGPYAYACHAAGHYEAGMSGTITVAG